MAAIAFTFFVFSVCGVAALSWVAASALGFDFDELCSIALNGFESAFLPWEERSAMLERVSAEIEMLRGGAA